MKRLSLLTILFVISFIFINNISAKDNNDYYFEKEQTIEFDNLSNKRINEVFKDLDIFMIEIDIEIDKVLRTYKINTYLTGNIEKEITTKIVKELNDEGKRELSTLMLYKGYLVKRVKLICSDRIIDIIKERII